MFAYLFDEMSFHCLLDFFCEIGILSYLSGHLYFIFFSEDSLFVYLLSFLIWKILLSKKINPLLVMFVLNIFINMLSLSFGYGVFPVAMWMLWSSQR